MMDLANRSFYSSSSQANFGPDHVAIFHLEFEFIHIGVKFPWKVLTILLGGILGILSWSSV